MLLTCHVGAGTLYTPPGYDKERDGRLPCLLWAYPRQDHLSCQLLLHLSSTMQERDLWESHESYR